VFDLEEKSATFDHIRRSGKAGSGSPESGLKSLVRNCKNEAEVKAIEEALSATHWNRKLAAARLHISYKSLLNKVKRYHMVPPFLDRAS
jgi:DNA-binding NtrC family response regulator